MGEEREWLSGERYWFGQLLTSFKAEGTAKAKGYTICFRKSSGASVAGWEKWRDRVEQKSPERQWGARFFAALWVIVRTLVFTLIEMRSHCRVLNTGVTWSGLFFKGSL